MVTQRWNGSSESHIIPSKCVQNPVGFSKWILTVIKSWIYEYILLGDKAPSKQSLLNCRKDPIKVTHNGVKILFAEGNCKRRSKWVIYRGVKVVKRKVSTIIKIFINPFWRSDPSASWNWLKYNDNISEDEVTGSNKIQINNKVFFFK